MKNLGILTLLDYLALLDNKVLLGFPDRINVKQSVGGGSHLLLCGSADILSVATIVTAVD